MFFKVFSSSIRTLFLAVSQSNRGKLLFEISCSAFDGVKNGSDFNFSNKKNHLVPGLGEKSYLIFGKELLN